MQFVNFIHPNYKTLLFSILLMGLVTNIIAQQKSLDLEECYQLAKENYPQLKKQGLIAKTSQYTIENTNNGYLPIVSFSAQASYQSQTINFADALGNSSQMTAFANAMPQISKDQYKIQAEVDEHIYDGGNGRIQKQRTAAGEAIQQQVIEVDFYKLKDRITQIYFSALLMQAQFTQNELRKSDLQSAVNIAESALSNGTSFRSNVDELKAELLVAGKASIQYSADRHTCIKLLSVFTGKDLDDSTRLIIPSETLPDKEINRPEIKLFNLQKDMFDVDQKELNSAYTPRLNAFFQGAYGRPTLNFLENKFGPWYITGIHLNWSLESLYNLKNNKALLNLKRQSIDIDKENFLRNIALDQTQQNGDIIKYKALLLQDAQEIKLRASVKQSALAQLKNGVITSHEYISQVNAENIARQTEIFHHLELIMANYKYNYASGN